MMKGYKAAKMSTVAIAIALVIGCSSDAEDKASESNEQVETIVQDSKQVTEEPKAPEFLDAKVSDPGPAERTEYTEPSFAQVFYSYHKITDSILPIETWYVFNINGLGFHPSFEAMDEYAKSWRATGAGAFEKRDAQRAWEENWKTAVLDNETPSRIMRTVPISYMTQKKELALYDFDTQSFKIDLKNGTSQDENVTTWASWGVSGNFGYAVVNVPSEIKVTDETTARMIEDLRQQGELSFKIYGGTVGAKEVKSGSNINRIVVADFHFGEAVNNKTDEVIFTF